LDGNLDPTAPRVFATSNLPNGLKMAGGKKKKKPASNPARGFATTSIASKPKAEAANVEPEQVTTQEPPGTLENQQGEAVPAVGSASGGSNIKQTTLTPEEFEKQLENSELQVLVEKYAQKSKRDALRQQTRLETDRRVLRSQAENLNTRKWLPAELMEEILDLVKGEGRYSGQSLESYTNSRQISEEDLTIRLWTLQQSLVGSGFTEERVTQALQYVLDISDRIGIGNKDTIWGMEEALDWLSRECSRDELPDYEKWNRKPGSIPKSQSGMQIPKI
jgi:ATP-dependent RNA helicase DHX29